MGDEYYNSNGSGEGFHLNYRKTLHDQIHAKTCYFYKDNDYKTAAAKVPIHPKRYPKFDNLLTELTRLIPSLPFGVRSVYTPRGRSHIRNTDSLMHEGRYICSTQKCARGVDVARVHPPDIWHQAKPQSGQRKLNELLQEKDYGEFSRAKRRRMAKSGGVNHSGKKPKKITVMCNGDPSFRHLMLLNHKTAPSFDQVLEDMSDMFKFAVRKLYTIDGSRINSLLQLFNGPDVIVVAGHERFKSMVGFMYTPVPPSARAGSDRNSVTSRRRLRRDRMVKTRGKWKISVSTGDDSNASTSSQVTITIYGQKGNSGPINLGNSGGSYFESGSVDDFEIFAPGIGEIYKIRVGHDSTGSYPAWYCEEVKLTDIDTGEELVFPCRKWMDNEQGDLETCREIPVTRKGEPRFQVVVYEATVTTGDLWNSGTDANVYMTIYGDRGDTGVRQLIPQKQNSFKQGQSDTFQIEAVQLGRLKRIIIGHDGTGLGSGWNLERILVKDPMKDEVFNFYCGRWLDEGEDDGKIVREIQAQEEYMGDILEKRNWESLKWKFENTNQVKIISELTGKCLRIKGDGSVDANGELNDEWAILNVVSAKKSMVRTFGSLLNNSYHLAIDNGRTVGHGKGGAFCEFRIHVQHDLTVLMESVKYPLQFVTFLDSGRPADSRGVVDSDSSRIFHVYCKGMFRNRGVIMFRTSRTQTLAQDPEEGIYGTGKVNRTAHFKIHKISDNGVRMFESVINPGRFIRVKSGIVDCQGGRDEASQFIVKKYPDKGYITLESCVQRGLYVGLTHDGFVKPTVDTGGKNVCLYPEVIEFGIPKRKDVDLDEDEFTNNPQSSQTPRTPKTPKTPKSSRIEEGTWKITVSSAETLENGNVSLVAYGDKGNTGPISLAAPTQNGPIFQSGSVDEFTANFLKAGKLFKVRLEVEGKNKKSDPMWRVREVKMEDLKTKEIMRLNFNRWLSPLHDDGSLMRELPVEHPGEKPLSVIKYMVIVQTGKEKGAATAANVYINLFGENGDCGKRFLVQSDHTRKFIAGQKDVFEIEAVELGNISKCLVGHDGTSSGDGWLLEHIVVREGENSKTEFVFPCKKWLDSSKDDRKIERVLAVRDSVPPSPLIKDDAEDTSTEHVHKVKTQSLKSDFNLPETKKKSETNVLVTPPLSAGGSDQRSPRPVSARVLSSTHRKSNRTLDIQKSKSLSPTDDPGPIINIQSKYSVLPPIESQKSLVLEENTNVENENNGRIPYSKTSSKVDSFESQELDSIMEEDEDLPLTVEDFGDPDETVVNSEENTADRDKISLNSEDRLPPIGKSPDPERRSSNVFQPDEESTKDKVVSENKDPDTGKPLENGDTNPLLGIYSNLLQDTTKDQDNTNDDVPENDDDIEKPENNDFIKNPGNNDFIKNPGNNDAIENPENNDAIENPENNDTVGNPENNDAVGNPEDKDTIEIPENNDANIEKLENNETIENPEDSYTVENPEKNYAIEKPENNDAIENLENNDAIENPTNNDSVENPENNGGIENPEDNDSIENPEENDVIENPENNDAIQNQENNNDAIENSENNDTIGNPEDNDAIENQEENDVIENPENNDAVENPEDNDGIENPEENDGIENPVNNDTFENPEENDVIENTENNDAIENPEENDAIENPEENDAIENPEENNDTIEKPENNDAIGNPENNDTIEKPENNDPIENPEDKDPIENPEDKDAIENTEDNGDIENSEEKDAVESNDSNKSDESEAIENTQNNDKKQAKNKDHPSLPNNDVERPVSNDGNGKPDNNKDGEEKEGGIEFQKSETEGKESELQ